MAVWTSFLWTSLDELDIRIDFVWNASTASVIGISHFSEGILEKLSLDLFGWMGIRSDFVKEFEMQEASVITEYTVFGWLCG